MDRLEDAFNWLGTRLRGVDSRLSLAEAFASACELGDIVYRAVRMKLGLKFASLGAVVAFGAVGSAQCPDYTSFSEVRVCLARAWHHHA